MDSVTGSELTKRIVEKARSLGAAAAGVAGVESLKESPSHRIYPKIGMNLKVHWQDLGDDAKPDGVSWPADAVSAVVIGVEHNAGKPELDWWDGKGTPGNRILIQINKKLSEWIENTFPIKTYQLPYFVSKGGIFLKDAAVAAGLGCIGKNNLVITPDFGPRMRSRAIMIGPAHRPDKPCFETLLWDRLCGMADRSLRRVRIQGDRWVLLPDPAKEPGSACGVRSRV